MAEHNGTILTEQKVIVSPRRAGRAIWLAPQSQCLSAAFEARVYFRALVGNDYVFTELSGVDHAVSPNSVSRGGNCKHK